jgi:D-threo-aldose 1-dehydrogenase
MPSPDPPRSPLEPVALGRTGLSVSRMGLGTAGIGALSGADGHAQALGCITRAVALGIAYIDTAPLYGRGAAERRVGEALASSDAALPLISTKAGRRPEGGEVVFDFSRDGILASVEESLTRLRRDRLDVVLVHDPDDHMDQALATALPALRQLAAEGVIGAIGVGTNRAEVAQRIVEQANPDCVLIAGRHTLLDRTALAGLLPACQANGIAVICGGVFNSGLLADPYSDPQFNYRPAPAALVARAQALDGICRRHGVPLRAAALQYPLRHPAVTCILSGSRSAAELDDNVRLISHAIPPELWDDVETLVALETLS